MVEELPEAAHGGAGGALGAVAAGVAVQARALGVVVGGVVALGDAEGGQRAGLAFEAGVLVAGKGRAGRRGDGNDEVDALVCCRAGGGVVVEVGGGGAVGA